HSFAFPRVRVLALHYTDHTALAAQFEAGRMRAPDRSIPMNKHLGSCLCGEVQFEIAGDFERFFLCHCGRCRKDTGSAHAANLFSSTAKVHWLSGQAKIKRFHVPSTRHEKCFCSECGSALPRIQMNGALL